VIILIIGLMKKFINPRTAPAKNKVLIPGWVSSCPPDIATPGTKRIAKYKPKMPTIICQKSCFTISFYQYFILKSINRAIAKGREERMFFDSSRLAGLGTWQNLF
jgi:hypothetical protein